MGNSPEGSLSGVSPGDSPGDPRRDPPKEFPCGRGQSELMGDLSGGYPGNTPSPPSGILERIPRGSRKPKRINIILCFNVGLLGATRGGYWRLPPSTSSHPPPFVSLFSSCLSSSSSPLLLGDFFKHPMELPSRKLIAEPPWTSRGAPNVPLGISLELPWTLGASREVQWGSAMSFLDGSSTGCSKKSPRRRGGGGG